ncbi:serine/threonine-protein phosphatase 7 long form homolog [Lycium barbarum]|uniref:serine/threonine-protein phosphatase 7 long form homolog n=1 Tax=Lycium barbarum TaxID=112863 RepID=UPI00293EDE14|nr:serine/threonine-protein phosphatase 7 long form homolog [Lycium barbarum]
MDRPKVIVHPGPENYDLLILQHEHRSQAVWDGNLTGKNACLTIRRADHEFWNHVRQYPLHNHILNYFERCGFGGFLAVGNVQYDEGIITALIERWRPETHTFHMRTGECTITLQDVEVLYGIPVDGHPLVQRNVKNITKSRWRELMYNLTGWLPGEEAIIGNSMLVITQLSNHLETLIANNDIIDEHTVRLSGSKLSLHFLLDIVDLDAIGGKAWGAAALSYLYSCLCRASMANSRDVCGFIVLLQVWAWERIIPMQPLLRPPRVNERDIVFAQKWTRRGVRESEARAVLVVCRDVLDNLTNDQAHGIHGVRHLAYSVQESPLEWTFPPLPSCANVRISKTPVTML